MTIPVPRSKRTLILILGALMTVSPLAIDMYLPAFSQIAIDFNTTTARISHSLASYFIGLAIGQLIYGPLLDRYGRKKPLYFGLSLFILASLGCMQSHSVAALVIFRIIQALGGCVAWVAAFSMVRDFFSVKESTNVFSLLVLILGASPLLAPTIGSLLTATLGWQWVFVVLASLAAIILLICIFFLPEGHQPDPTVSLRAKPMLLTFKSILTHPQFFTYGFAGSFSFSALFAYLAGSPVIFLEIYKVTPQTYGLIFSFISIGFIGGSQLNMLLTKKYSSEKIFRTMITAQVIVAIIFLIGAYFNWLGFYSTLGLFFSTMFCVGIINPNASSLTLAPFAKNAGSASALNGSFQIGLAALVSTSVGSLNSQSVFPIIAILAGGTFCAFTVYAIGMQQIGDNLVTSDEETPGII